jgi:hypothetical protein
MLTDIGQPCRNPGCDKRVRHEYFACGRCWPLLPDDIRRAINKYWKPAENKQSAAYLAAALRARAWFIEHNQREREPGQDDEESTG